MSKAPERILIIKPSSLGDVVHAIPFIRIFKLYYKKSEIYWWIEKNYAPLIENDVDINGIFYFDRKCVSSPIRFIHFLKETLRMLSFKFDMVIDLQGLLRSALMARLSNGVRVIGLDTAREGASSFYDEVVPVYESKLHAIDRLLSVLEYLKIPIIWDFEWIPKNSLAYDAISRRLKANGKSRWIGIVPGARWFTKRWPPHLYSQVIAEISSRYPDVRFGIIGSKDELNLAIQVASGAPEKCEIMAGNLTLPELVEFIRQCWLFISNDTGPMHIAAALRCPTIAIFGPTDPNKTGPYGQLYNVLSSSIECAPCFSRRCVTKEKLKCLYSISPLKVVEKASFWLECKQRRVAVPWHVNE